MSFSASKALKSSLILLSGDEEQLRRRALEEIFAELQIARDDFDLEFTDADVTAPSDWVGLASTVPFLAERRVLVVRHLLRRDVEDAAGVPLDALPPTSLLIFIADEELYNSEDKARKLASSRGKWERLVAKAGGVVEQFKSEPKQAKEIIRREANRIGHAMSDKAADVLLEMTGGNLSRALDELLKLSVYVGKEAPIREDDVQAAVMPSREYNVFNLIDAIVAGAVPNALRQIRILVGSQSKAEEAAISRIVPMMSRTLKLLWQARLCIDAGCVPSRTTPELREMFPSKPNILDEKPYRQASLMNLAKKADLPKLQRCLQVLADTDARLKGVLPAFSGMETMERMVLDMSDALAPSARS